MRAGWICLLWLAGTLLPREAAAQLAVTEVLPVSRVNTNTFFHGAEFWELTNFGTNDIDLHGYGFRDSKPLRPLVKRPFTNLVIRAGESVIFFRIERNNNWVVQPEDFKAWWGESNLSSGLQCRTYDEDELGLSAWDGDEVWICDAAENFVDAVRFGRARGGFSFTYHPETGHFGVLSENGTNAAFTAELTPDVGSPGVTSGPMPVHFLIGPADIAADGGMTVTFSVTAGGMPPPRHQWLFEGLPVFGATASSLTLLNVQPSHAGAYRVVITNGLSAATSAIARLTVNTSPTPPSIVSAPADTSVFIGQAAAFVVSARGYPPPQYQWQTNGADIPGAVGAALDLAGVGVDLNGASVSVIVSNSVGWTSASARLSVTRWPDLRFTEVLAVPARVAENRVFGWVELTNFDTNTVDLLGWRFAEEDSFALAVTITNSITLAPRESLVIAERLDKARFGRWWGERALPENFKLYAYSGFGLESFGGTFYLWNAAARDAQTEFVTAVSWAASIPGVSYECEFWCDEGRCISEAFLVSSLGVHGAFASTDGLDIGSPGYTEAPALKIVAISREPADQMALTCKVIAGRSYQLWRTGSLAAPVWLPAQTITAANNTITFIEGTAGASSFFRVEALP